MSSGNVLGPLFYQLPLGRNYIGFGEVVKIPTTELPHVKSSEILLADLVASYLFQQAKLNFCPKIYHGIYRDDGLVVFKGKKKSSEKKYCVE